MEVEVNPLIALEDKRLFELFARMLAHRYRTDILHDYYRLQGIPTRFTWFTDQITPAEKAGKELEFLQRGSRATISELEDFVQQFWNRFSPRGNHLHEHIDAENKYNEIAIGASDLKLLKPLFYFFPNHLALDIADIGAGRNRLGKEILKCFDGMKDRASYFNWLGHLGGETPKVSVVGTDVDDLRDPADRNSGAPYHIQPSATKIPLENESRDIVITKWSFHHMKRQQMERQIHNIFHILRPGGIVIVIEAFLTTLKALPPEPAPQAVEEPSFAQQLLEISRRIEFADIWPDGAWKKDCYEISVEYLNLPFEDQHALLALEDFFGHYVLNRREKMPFPFSYIPAEELIQKFVSAGFCDQRWNFLLFGFAPIIRRGPPTARFIFQRPVP